LSISSQSAEEEEKSQQKIQIQQGEEIYRMHERQVKK